ncbi:MAG: hypothetical protein A2942_00460 [Candidatus Lloydbacteria bacterium RIFCSPLOWO2_01_FULL_50_20]|uniref:Phosphoglycerate mutase n=1 Tax=Candidatus Lloydbacteria bacterium RIFCSPLOWO2_01_FULL_50_20 TaxID=1798665 RepID=A0A1G2DE72_9BACT|nr:MAG: hypothetical protein A3C13_02180 [Candidatus Lloydbacteria bacterium RIFCSPHIGHO2_02_FULL_50_11]OGZ11251.1 MAG: hypothetical protein A2942_00460 [Candidatus Lloydbacteria bacterium RIFCSPLOWO2_01_FULL_50_20]
MSSKHVYFVRHGESVANATGIRQGPKSQLSEKGRIQASAVAKRIAQLPVGCILVSPYVRTTETARPLIDASCPASVEYSELFIERVNPSIMLGTKAGVPETEQIWDEIAKHYGVPGWRYSDEENFEDLILRAKKALTLLETLPERTIVVVSHGMFMKVIFAYVLLGEQLNGRTFWDKFVPAKNVANTGIMHLEYTENYWKTGMLWKLHSWNDHAHLDEHTRIAKT